MVEDIGVFGLCKQKRLKLCYFEWSYAIINKSIRKAGAVMKREDYISDKEVVKRANAAVKIELEKKKAMNIPVAVYDRKTQTIYQVSSDGTKTEVGKRIGKGRYSERIAKKS